jgi:hypothetical protein
LHWLKPDSLCQLIARGEVDDDLGRFGRLALLPVPQDAPVMNQTFLFFPSRPLL